MKRKSLSRYDYHTHNGFYRGSLEEWTMAEGWAVAQKKGIELLGISDKLEFNHSNQDYVPILREELTQLNNPKVLLGVELDIGHPNGQNVMTETTASYLDYVIAGPHNHPVDTLLWDDLDEEDLVEYFDNLRDILLNSFKNAPVSIWAHPFLQELGHTAGQYWKYIEPILYTMLDYCGKKNIALEINENCFRSRNPPKQAESRWPSNEDYFREKSETIKRIFEIALHETDVPFSFASDTHSLHAVGDIDHSVQFAESIGIPESRLLVIAPKS